MSYSNYSEILFMVENIDFKDMEKHGKDKLTDNVVFSLLYAYSDRYDYYSYYKKLEPYISKNLYYTILGLIAHDNETKINSILKYDEISLNFESIMINMYKNESPSCRGHYSFDRTSSESFMFLETQEADYLNEFNKQYLPRQINLYTLANFISLNPNRSFELLYQIQIFMKDIEKIHFYKRVEENILNHPNYDPAKFILKKIQGLA